MGDDICTGVSEASWSKDSRHQVREKARIPASQRLRSSLASQKMESTITECDASRERDCFELRDGALGRPTRAAYSHLWRI